MAQARQAAGTGERGRGDPDGVVSLSKSMKNSPLTVDSQRFFDFAWPPKVKIIEKTTRRKISWDNLSNR